MRPPCRSRRRSWDSRAFRREIAFLSSNRPAFLPSYRRLPVHSPAVDEPSLWCPSCGSEYRPGTNRCADCRVALVMQRPAHLAGENELDDDDDDGGDGLVELGEWPKIQAQVLRRRLETASVPVMIEWSGSADDPRGVVLVPEDQ